MVYSPVQGIFSLSGQIFSAGNSLVLLSTSAYKREAYDDFRKSNSKKKERLISVYIKHL
jgi:hypothetical protein